MKRRIAEEFFAVLLAMASYSQSKHSFSLDKMNFSWMKNLFRLSSVKCILHEFPKSTGSRCDWKKSLQ